MTYTIGSQALASDYNTFRGPYDPSQAYPDAGTATNCLAALIGVGYGQRGYGQSLSFPEVSAGDTITAAQWGIILSAMTTINTHTGAGLTLQPSVSAGDLIRANDGSVGRVNLPTLISSLDTARLSYDIGQMSLTSALTSTRNTVWNTQVYHEFTIDFGTEDRARYFFNSGGTIYASASRTGGSVTPENTDMTNMLSAMGTIKFGATTSTYTGTGGTVASIGYYGLTGVYQQIFIHNGSGAYSSSSYTLNARRESYVGLNGANGSLVRMQASFDTGLDPTHTLDGTLTSSISQLKASGVLTITAPTYTTITNL